MGKMAAVDLGSSSIKGCVIDLPSGAMGAIRQVPFPERLPHSSARRFEVDLQQIVECTIRLLTMLIEEEPAVNSIWCCSQMGGLVLTDPHGLPLSQYLSWRDQRLLDATTRPYRRAGAPSIWSQFTSLTTKEDLWHNGHELQLGSTTALLYALNEIQVLPAQPFLAMQLGDFVVAQLTHSVPRTHVTMALGTIDLETGERMFDWFDRLGLRDVSWPAIADLREPLGNFRYGGRKIPCYAAIGDHQAALFGVGLDGGALSINVSTGSQVSCVTTDLLRGDYQTRPYGDGRFLNTITHLPAGRALNGLVSLLCELADADGHPVGDPWRLIERAAQKASEASRVGDLVDAAHSALPGAANPLEMEITFFAGPLGDSGRIENVRLENLHVGDWFLAAYRSMARNYRQCADRICGDTHPQAILFSGGFMQRSPCLKQMIAEQFNAPATVVEGEEETLRGLYRFASFNGCK